MLKLRGLSKCAVLGMSAIKKYRSTRNRGKQGMQQGM